eukprot:1503160-Prymnesium_polylepis.1
MLRRRPEHSQVDLKRRRHLVAAVDFRLEGLDQVVHVRSAAVLRPEGLRGDAGRANLTVVASERDRGVVPPLVDRSDGSHAGGAASVVDNGENLSLVALHQRVRRAQHSNVVHVLRGQK